MREYKDEFFYLITIGRNSGDPHEIEIWYVEHGGRFYLVSEFPDRADWVKNIQQNPAVQFRVGLGDWQDGNGRAIDREAEPELAALVSELMDAKYNWSDGLIVEIAGD